MKLGKKLFSIVYKGYVGIVFGTTLLTFYPAIYILLLRPKWKRKTMPLFSSWSGIFQFLILMPTRKNKKHNFPKTPFILCANHASYMDIAMMPFVLRKVNFLFIGKHEILSYPIIKTFFKRLHIPVNRENKLQAARSFVKASKAIDEGWSIVIFPEGGIPDENRPKMMDFKAGAFKLAMDKKVPIVPITFLDNYRLFSDPDDFLGHARPGISRVVVHPTITPESYSTLSIDELKEKVYSIIDEPLKELY